MFMFDEDGNGLRKYWFESIQVDMDFCNKNIALRFFLRNRMSIIIVKHFPLTAEFQVSSSACAIPE